MVAAAHVVVALQTIVSRRVDPLEPAVITVGAIHAGSKHNIISDRAKMQITVRSYTDDTRKVLLDGIREVAVNTCRALGCAKDPEVIIREQEYTPATYNDPELAVAAAGVFKQLLGSDNVILAKPVMGGEDFGRFPKHLGVPGLKDPAVNVKGPRDVGARRLCRQVADAQLRAVLAGQHERFLVRGQEGRVQE